jgi:hypothetical protein
MTVHGSSTIGQRAARDDEQREVDAEQLAIPSSIESRASCTLGTLRLGPVTWVAGNLTSTISKPAV